MSVFRILPLLVFVVFSLCGQDPGLVLTTVVSYRGAEANAPAEKKPELQRLREQAMAHNAQGRRGEALRLLHKGFAMMRGLEWTPENAAISSLLLSADHAVWEPGDTVRLKLKRLYPPESGAPESLEASVSLKTTQGGSSAELGTWTVKGETPELAIAVPKVAAGTYRVEVRFPAGQPKTVTVSVQPGLRARAENLEKRIAKLKAPAGTALWTAEYGPELFRRADRSEVSLAGIDPAAAIARAEALVSALEDGKDPLRNARGHLYLALRSSVDSTLQPYRLYVPSTWDAAKPAPLVIALHGMGGDENTMFDRYGDRALEQQAEKHGMLIAAPKGREPASMYRGAAAQDVLDTITQVRADRTVDPLAIHMTGHSMGAFGTWSIAIANPDLFASLAPVSGGGDPSGMARIAHLPEIVVHGDNDAIVPVNSSRAMVEAGKKAGAEIEYIEVKGGGHNEVVVPHFPRIFEWFASHRKKTGAAAAAK